MTREALLELRKNINDALLPLVLEGDHDPAEQASLILGMLQAGNQDEKLFRRALETISKIDDKEQKTDFLFQLLGEVEVGLQAVDEGEQEQGAADIELQLPDEPPLVSSPDAIPTQPTRPAA